MRHLRVVKFTEVGSRRVAAKDWQGGERMRIYCLTGTEFALCKMKKVLEMDGGNCRTII